GTLQNKYLNTFPASKVDHQLWKAEVRAAFEFTLAGMQLAVINTITAIKPELRQGLIGQVLPERALSQICNGMLKVRMAKKTNIHLPGFLIYVAFLIMIGSMVFLVRRPG